MVHTFTRIIFFVYLCTILTTSINIKGTFRGNNKCVDKCGCNDTSTQWSITGNKELMKHARTLIPDSQKEKEQKWCMERWKASILGKNYVAREEERSFYEKLKKYKETHKVRPSKMDQGRPIMMDMGRKGQDIADTLKDITRPASAIVKKDFDRMKRGRAMNFHRDYLDSCSFCKYFFTGNSSYDPTTGLVPNSHMWQTVSWTEVMIGVLVLAGLLTLYSLWPNFDDRNRR